MLAQDLHHRMPVLAWERILERARYLGIAFKQLQSHPVCGIGSGNIALYVPKDLIQRLAMIASDFRALGIGPQST